MPHDPSRIAETRKWFVIVASDLRSAGLVLGAGPPLLEDALFHCQQAAEKALKGFLTWHSQPFRKVHDLHELGEQCVGVDATLEDLLRRAASLTKYQIMYRYPGGDPEPTPAEAQSMLALAREVVEAILSRLPDEVRL